MSTYVHSLIAFTFNGKAHIIQLISVGPSLIFGIIECCVFKHCGCHGAYARTHNTKFLLAAAMTFRC